jgi:hypothetical protein
MKRLQSILFYLFAIPFSLIWIYLGATGVMEGQSSLSWPCTTGTIETVGVSSWSSRLHRNWKNRHSFLIHYRFTVTGAEKTGERITTDDLMYGSVFSVGDRGLTHLRTRYAPGTEVSVCYDPTDPQGSAVLQPGISFGSVVRLVGGVLVALIVVLPFTSTRFRQNT